jgi:hypothetical protein
MMFCRCAVFIGFLGIKLIHAGTDYSVRTVTQEKLKQNRPVVKASSNDLNELMSLRTNPWFAAGGHVSAAGDCQPTFTKMA